MKFTSYNLDKQLIDTLIKLGYTDATPIQENTIAKILKGKSLICKSETGSGKTHAFLIPIINNIDKELNKIQSVIISPTVELAKQTYEFAKQICDQISGLSVKLLTSISSVKEDLSSLNYGNEMPKIIVGTPGRIHDILVKEKSDCSKVSTIVLDEADMLMDKSYQDQIVEIFERCQPKQRLVFTATMKEHLIQDAYKFVGAEEIIDIDKKTKVNRNVSHHLVDIRQRNIVDSLVIFLKIEKPFFTLVFASQKTQVEKIYHDLNERGIECGIINGDMETRERKIMMRRIINQDFSLVLCSDIASRGIDLQNVSTIISVDLPNDLDYYYHRAGRTGRNNKKGDSFVFYNSDNMKNVNKLIKNGLQFDSFILKEDSLKKIEKSNKTNKKENTVLQAQIKKAISKVRTNKVKPGYKKKIRLAVEKVKKQHKEQIIKKNIREKKKKEEMDF